MKQAVAGRDDMVISPVADPPHKSGAAWVADAAKLRYQTPFLLTDLGLARSTVSYLKQLLPRVELYYAIKSNRDPQLLAAIEDLVAGFEIASLGEFHCLEQLGIRGERILFSNPVKVPHHLSVTAASGVSQFAFDSLGELDKLARYAPGSQVYLRIKVADDASAFPLSKKFGTPVSQAAAYMQRAAELGLAPYGLAFHVGSQSQRPEAWTRAIDESARVIAALAKAGITIRVLDIGGGLPASYSDRPLSLRPMAAAINEALERLIASSVRVVAEPGRAISGPSGMLVATVIGRDMRSADEAWLFLDIGAFQGLIEPLQVASWRYPIFTDYMGPHEPQQRFVLTGPTCDPDDTIGSDYLLPARLKPGDRLYIGSAGAYTAVYGSHFNGFAPPDSYVLHSL